MRIKRCPRGLMDAGMPGGHRGRKRIAFAFAAGMLLGSISIAASIYWSYRFAESIGEALGEAAMNVIIRLSSFILVCIGVQILWNGVSALLRTVAH